MAGGVRTAADPDVKSLMIPVDDSHQNSKPAPEPTHNVKAGPSAVDQHLKEFHTKANQQLKDHHAAVDQQVKVLQATLDAKDKDGAQKAGPQKVAHVEAGANEVGKDKVQAASKPAGHGAEKPASNAGPLGWVQFVKDAKNPDKWKPDFGMPTTEGRIKEYAKQLDKAASNGVQAAGKIAQDFVLEATRKAAQDAGSYHENTKDNSSPAAQTKETKGDTTITKISGAYEVNKTKTYDYTVAGNIGGAGAGASIELANGWQARTIESVDRYGVKSQVTEMWVDAKFTRSADAKAEASSAGAAVAKGSFFVSVSAEGGIAVTAFDHDSGTYFTKTGKIKAEASATGSAEGRVGADRSQVGFKLGAEAAVGTENSVSWNAMDERWGFSLGTQGKVGAAANVERAASFRSNPIDGFGFKFSNDDYVSSGLQGGLNAKIKTDVTRLEAAVNGMVGQMSGTFKVDGGWKDGKLRLDIKLGKAAGLGASVEANLEIDFARWGENIGYRVDKQVKEFKEGTFWEKAWAINKLTNPYLIPFQIGSVLFGESKPLPESVEIKWSPDGKTKGEIAGRFAEEVRQFAKVPENNLLSEILKGKTDSTFRWSGINTLDYFGFDHPKALSDRIAKVFGESQVKEVKDLELTFTHRLPTYVAFDFLTRPDPNDPTKDIPDLSRGAYSIFSGQMSLVQYLSIEEHLRVAKMEKAEAEHYLRTDEIPSAHLTGDARAKLWNFWQAVQEEKERELKADPPPYRSDVPSERYEDKLWWHAKNAVKNGTPEKQRIVEIDEYARAMSTEYGCKDGVLTPLSWTSTHQLYKWTGVPRAEDGRHLIDLTEVKQGKIGLTDVLYQNELKVLAKLGSPQAVYEYMTSANHIAAGSKGHFLQMWLDKNGHGTWRYDTDAASKNAQTWWATHEADYRKVVDAAQYWEIPSKAPKADFRW